MLFLQQTKTLQIEMFQITSYRWRKKIRRKTNKKNQLDAPEKKSTNQKKKKSDSKQFEKSTENAKTAQKKTIQMKSEWSLINILIHLKNRWLIWIAQNIWLQMSQFLSSNKQLTARSQWSTVRFWRFKKLMKLNSI